MSIKLIRTAVFATALVLSPVVLANSCGEGLKSMVESLKLDDGQKAKITPVLEQLRSSIKTSAEQMKDISKQLNEQTESATMDQSAVDGLIDKKTKLIGEMMKAKVSAKNQIYAVLKPEQKTKLHDKMKQVEMKWSDKFKSCHDDE